MHFNIYLDDETGARLTHLAKSRNRTRNSMVREAVAELLARQEVKGWPQEVMEFQGVAGMPPFESHRPPKVTQNDDPLG